MSFSLNGVKLAIGHDPDSLLIGLEESVQLQSHYAELLNAFDGGERIGFKDAEAWLARLRDCGKLPAE